MQLSALPSEIMVRHVYGSLTDEAMFVNSFEVLPPSNELWCSDFPHLSSTWPESDKWIDQILTQVSDDDRRLMVHDSAARLYFS